MQGETFEKREIEKREKLRRTGRETELKKGGRNNYSTSVDTPYINSQILFRQFSRQRMRTTESKESRRHIKKRFFENCRDITCMHIRINDEFDDFVQQVNLSPESLQGLRPLVKEQCAIGRISPDFISPFVIMMYASVGCLTASNLSPTLKNCAKASIA